MEILTDDQLEQAILTLQQCIKLTLSLGLTETVVTRVTRNTIDDWTRNTTATS